VAAYSEKKENQNVAFPEEKETQTDHPKCQIAAFPEEKETQTNHQKY
jgi:hypothetical protein